jgi:polyhydroxybutyrate depolymerase
MALKKYCIIALVAVMTMVLPAGTHVALAQESSPGLHTAWVMETYDGYNGTWSCNRTYEYYIPSSYDGSEAVPLLFSFHGIGSTGDEQRDLSRFDELAEQEGFIAVFLDATTLTEDDNPCAANLIGKYNPLLAGLDLTQWNLGLNWSLQYCAGVDDVGFVSDIIDSFETSYNIDTSRIYATGMSLGAFFSYYVALMLPDMFAGIAPVCGPMLANMFEFEDIPPLTVITMMGPPDPIVPYDGDETGTIKSMDDTIAFWLDVDGITSGPVETVWGPTSRDSSVVHRYVYSGGTDGTEVIFFKIDRGGHTWPGGPLYSAYVGAVTTHIDGSALIWRYLPPEKYYLEISSTLGGDVITPGQETFANVESTGAYMFFDAGTGDTVVDLEAVPKSDSWEFVNWTGDVSTVADVDATTTTITITPNRDYEITANFQVKSEEPEPEPEPTSSGGLCFIATAAYGTCTAKPLDVLREFRDDVLLESTIGSRLVDLYYQVSPPIADFISEHSFVRTLARELLIDPIVWVVEASGDMWRN